MAFRIEVGSRCCFRGWNGFPNRDFFSDPCNSGGPVDPRSPHTSLFVRDEGLSRSTYNISTSPLPCCRLGGRDLFEVQGCLIEVVSQAALQLRTGSLPFAAQSEKTLPE